MYMLLLLRIRDESTKSAAKQTKETTIKEKENYKSGKTQTFEDKVQKGRFHVGG